MFRSVLCFWTEDTRRPPCASHDAAGPEAIAAYLEDPLDSRLIMSMKTYLAQRSFTETRIFGHRFTLERLIGQFLRALLAGAPPAPRVIVGRPVRFAGEFADDALGADRLRGAYAEAGLPEVTLALEPEAAGTRFARTLTEPATVLIGDFGGGTSDFSVLRFDPRSRSHAARPCRHRHRRRRVRLPHHRPRDRAAARQGRHLPGDGQAAAGAAGVLLAVSPAGTCCR